MCRPLTVDDGDVREERDQDWCPKPHHDRISDHHSSQL